MPFGFEPWQWTLIADALWAGGAVAAYFMLKPFLSKNVLKVLVELRFLLIFFLLYDFTRLLVLGSPETAMRHAYFIHNIEVATHLDMELWMQRKVLEHYPLIKVFNHFYVWMHFAEVKTFFGWLLYRRYGAPQYDDDYKYQRNVFATANGISMIVWDLFPCAPPRMLNDLGFMDTLVNVSKIDIYNQRKTRTNPFAAFPSMHLGWAYICIAGTIQILRIQGWKKWLLYLYPVMMLLSIMITGNHWFLDGVAGFLIVELSYKILDWTHNYDTVWAMFSPKKVPTTPPPLSENV